MADRCNVTYNNSKRRTTTQKRNTPVPIGRTPDLFHSRKLMPENRTDISDTPKFQIGNTYRMIPEEKFAVAKMETLMSEILETRLKAVDYCSKTCSELTKELARTMTSRSKAFKWERYKMVIQVLVGQNENQDVQVASRCMWNENTDTFACASYKNASLFAVASCYGVYFE